jgi:hypothetical protein
MQENRSFDHAFGTLKEFAGFWIKGLLLNRMAILPFSKKINRKIRSAGPSGSEEYQINMDEFSSAFMGKPAAGVQ